MVSMVSMICLRFPWFPCCPRFLYGFHSLHGFHDFFAFSMISVQFSWFLCGFCDRLPLLPTLLPFVHKHRFLGFIFSFFFFQHIHRDLCLCASFLIFSFLLAIYPLRLVPMCFSLGTHCGGRRCALPLHPPTRFYF